MYETETFSPTLLIHAAKKARAYGTQSPLGCGTGVMDSAGDFDLLGEWVP